MRRYPNPWIAVPALVGAMLGGAIAYALSGCAGVCGRGIAWGLLFAIVTGIGFGTVAVLADRSIVEWREAVDQGREPPSPGCEVPTDDPR